MKELVREVTSLLERDGLASPLPQDAAEALETWTGAQQAQQALSAAMEQLQFLEGAALTVRENEVLALRLEGMTQQAIANTLQIPRTTIESMLNRILAKLRAAS